MNANADTTMTIHINSEVKREAQEIFAELGMDLSTAINELLSQAIYYGGFPFDTRQHEPNAETLAAIEEVQALKKDPNKKTYRSFAELLEDLDA